MDNNNFTVNTDDKEGVCSLILRAREGSLEAFGELKSRYTPLIESQVAKHTLPDMNPQDVEDIRQEALTIFCNAVCNYDVSADEVEFGLYAKICMQNGLISFVRSYSRRKKRLPLSLEDKTVQDKTVASVDFLQALVNKENTTALVRIIGKSLSDYENRVWWMYVSGMSVSDIAEALGDVPPKSVSNAIYRIRRKLKSVLIDLN